MTTTDENSVDPAEASASPSLEHLEAEGDFAADYIEGLLDIADVDGDINIEVRNQRAYVAVTGGDTSLDTLSHPETVTALQELTRLAVQTQTGEYSRLILDIAGSRQAREQELQQLVEHAIVALTAGQTQVELEPMSSYERKLVHDFVAERGYFSESRGEGKDRRLVIRLAQ